MSRNGERSSLTLQNKFLIFTGGHTYESCVSRRLGFISRMWEVIYGIRELICATFHSLVSLESMPETIRS